MKEFFSYGLLLHDGDAFQEGRLAFGQKPGGMKLLSLVLVRSIKSRISLKAACNDERWAVESCPCENKYT
jgi:hypothetical protein